MKQVFFVLCVAVTWSMIACGADSAYLLRDGKSDYVIVVGASASPSEKHAAEELHTFFKSCTGVTLPIADKAPASGPMIVLGCGEVAQKLGVDPKPEELGEQGYVIKTVGPESFPTHLVIAGSRAAGTLYGVYDFLEAVLGVRWYDAQVTLTPQTKDIALPAFDKLFKPPFAYRNTSSLQKPTAEFRARTRDNSGTAGPDNSLGVQYTFDGSCHSYFSYISPKEFFAAHPEYFSEIGGVQRSGETQLCLTNPDVLEIVTERMLKRMAEMPANRQFNFSQMDYYSQCECPKCRAMNEKYGSNGGTQFWFVNQLAERTSKKFPDKLVSTLAYMFTDEPPKGMIMHPNVAIWLCHMFPSCDSHPIATCPLNAEYKRRAEAWSKLCSHLYIWHYTVDFAHLYNPFPNLRALPADIRFYRDLGVEGVYLQGWGDGGELCTLRPYYMMKLLWNPDLDADAVLRDFLNGYYGAAAEPIGKYINLLHDKVEKENIHMHLYTNPAQGYLPNEVLAEANGLFDQAEQAVAADKDVLERVRVARMPLTYAGLFPRNGYTIDKGMLRFTGPFAGLPEVNNFLNRMKDHHFGAIRETAGDPKQMLMIWGLVNTPMPLVTLANDQIAVDIAPTLGGRVLRIIDKKSGQCVTAYNTKRALFFPFAGGEETRTGGTFLDTAVPNLAVFNLVQRNDTSATIELDLGGGSVMRRTVSLVGRELFPAHNVGGESFPAHVEIKTSVLNGSDKPREVAVRSHLELDLGAVADTRVAFTSRTGQQVAKDMKPIIANLREGEHYLDQNAPNGSWTFTGTNGRQVTQSFDDNQIDFTWLYAYPEDLNELEVEVWAKTVTVAPKETFTFVTRLEVK